MIALIDGDVVVYRVGFASQEQTEAQNCMNTELVVEDILTATDADSYRVFLSDSLENNFRFKIDPQYKANRKDAAKPKYYDSIRKFLLRKYNAEFTPGQEADDALGIEQVRHTQAVDKQYVLDPTSKESLGVDLTSYGTVICSIDKDLLQIPGRHYNLSTGAHTTVTWFEGLRHFYSQLLIGDRVDNIEGIYGLGPKKTSKLLGHLDTEPEMFEVVRELYQDDERLLKNGRLLWIRRQENELWEFPKGKSLLPEGEKELTAPLSSTPLTTSFSGTIPAHGIRTTLIDSSPDAPEE